jgi:hypothetical protein
MEDKLITAEGLQSESRKLYLRWRVFELISACFSNMGIVTSMIDYETGFADSRNYHNCTEHSTQVYRWITLIFTFVAAFLLLQRHWVKVKWYNSRPEIVNHTQKEALQRRKQIKKQKKFLSWHLMVDLVILAIFPYPYLNATLTIIQSRKENSNDGSDNTVHLCYTLSEFFLIFTFARSIFLLRALFNFTPYQDDHARYYCARYRTKANVRFSIRCMLRTKPSLIILAFILPSFFVLGYFLRVFERPYSDVSDLNFASYLNAVWCCAVTMATIGYGDLYPGTLFGRIVAIGCAVWGAFAFSMIVFTLESSLQLNQNQNKAFQAIVKSRAAAKVIVSSLYFNVLKNRHGNDSHQARVAFKKVLKRLQRYKATVKKLINTSSVDKNDDKNKERFKKLSKHMTRIEEKLDRVLKVYN